MSAPQKDIHKKSLHARRPLLNRDEVAEWARGQGLAHLVTDITVTTAYSRAHIIWPEPRRDVIVTTIGERASGAAQRRVAIRGALMETALHFRSGLLAGDVRRFAEHGARWPAYRYEPFIVLTYRNHGLDLDLVEPFLGPLEFGNEIFTEIDLLWDGDVAESATETRHDIASTDAHP